MEVAIDPEGVSACFTTGKICKLFPSADSILPRIELGRPVAETLFASGGCGQFRGTGCAVRSEQNMQ